MIRATVFSLRLVVVSNTAVCGVSQAAKVTQLCDFHNLAPVCSSRAGASREFMARGHREAVRLGADTLEVEYRDGYEDVPALKGELASMLSTKISRAASWIWPSARWAAPCSSGAWMRSAKSRPSPARSRASLSSPSAR